MERKNLVSHYAVNLFLTCETLPFVPEIAKSMHPLPYMAELFLIRQINFSTQELFFDDLQANVCSPCGIIKAVFLCKTCFFNKGFPRKNESIN